MDEWKKINRQLQLDHTVRRISTLVDQFDLEPLLQTYEASKRQPLNPRAMLRACSELVTKHDTNQVATNGSGKAPDQFQNCLNVILFEYYKGKLSPVRWRRDSKEWLPVMWILGGLQPGRSLRRSE